MLRAREKDCHRQFLAQRAALATRTISWDRPQLTPLETRWMPDHESGKLTATASPAGSDLGQGHGVKPPAGDRHPHVAGVGIDRDPATGSRIAPGFELA